MLSTIHAVGSLRAQVRAAQACGEHLYHGTRRLNAYVIDRGHAAAGSRGRGLESHGSNVGLVVYVR